MQIEDIFQQRPAGGGGAGPWTVTLRYFSKGDSQPGFPTAILLRVDDGPEKSLDLAQGERKVEQTFDITAEMKDRSEIHIKIDTYRLQFENLGIDVVSTAEVVVKNGRTSVFSRKYDSDKLAWLRTEEKIKP